MEDGYYDRAYRELRTFDLSRVQERLIKTAGWRLPEALDGIEQYRHFLFLVKKYAGQTLVPSQDVDEVWHAHVLFTKIYREDCLKILGRMLEHNPSDNIDPASYNQTQALHEKEFGFKFYKIMGLSGKIARWMVGRNGRKLTQRPVGWNEAEKPVELKEMSI